MNGGGADPERRRNAALQDAGATTRRFRPSAKFWSAPVFRRFRFVDPEFRVFLHLL